MPYDGRDLRVLVAGGAVVGAVERAAAPGEWRTNVALGAARRPTIPPERACAASLSAAAALAIDLACVDLILPPGEPPVVLEVNGAPDFSAAYSLDGDDVFEAVLRGIGALQPHLALAR